MVVLKYVLWCQYLFGLFSILAFMIGCKGAKVENKHIEKQRFHRCPQVQYNFFCDLDYTGFNGKHLMKCKPVCDQQKSHFIPCLLCNTLFSRIYMVLSYIHYVIRLRYLRRNVTKYCVYNSNRARTFINSATFATDRPFTSYIILIREWIIVVSF